MDSHKASTMTKMVASAMTPSTYQGWIHQKSVLSNTSDGLGTRVFALIEWSPLSEPLNHKIAILIAHLQAKETFLS
jgi:hypothetical protein